MTTNKKMTRAEAGKRSRNVTKERHGLGYYREIGRKGGSKRGRTDE